MRDIAKYSPMNFTRKDSCLFVVYDMRCCLKYSSTRYLLQLYEESWQCIADYVSIV